MPKRANVMKEKVAQAVFHGLKDTEFNRGFPEGTRIMYDEKNDWYMRVRIPPEDGQRGPRYFTISIKEEV